LAVCEETGQKHLYEHYLSLEIPEQLEFIHNASFVDYKRVAQVTCH
jgi:hypothetical protein